MNHDEHDARIADWMAAERLPPAFRATIETIFAPLATCIRERARHSGKPYVVGMCGPQGSGKSTGAAAIRLLLEAEGLRVAVLSLDDFYLTHAERAQLAATTHPLLATRGPPGTHDLALATATLDRLASDAQVPLPSFDKAIDDRRPIGEWPVFDGPADVIVLEGWCVGARPAPAETLAHPINALEREMDGDGTWRGFVNTALAVYQSLFARLDFLILLKPPGFEVVARWREEQEAKLRDRTGVQRDLRVMTRAEVGRFVQHYERVTREILREMPMRADALVELGPERELQQLIVRA